MAATKLKNLKVTNVDFVDEGANPDAHIMLYKRRDDDNAEPKQEPQETEQADGSILKRFFTAIGKAVGMKHEDVQAAVEEIEKQHSGFTAYYSDRQTDVIREESFAMMYALHDSIMSVLYDGELRDPASKATAMQENLNEFVSTVTSSIPSWSAGKVSGVAKRDDSGGYDIGTAQAAVESLNQMIEKHGGCEDVNKDDTVEEDGNEPKGEDDDMKIDKSKMTPAERAFFEEIEKRYGAEEPAAEPNGEQPTVTEPAAGVAKGADAHVEPTIPVVETDDSTDVYKGLHPEVKAELEALRKFREAQEDRELREVAKRYALIGKKEDELLPVLKSLKAAGGTAYDDMIAVLDSTVTAVEKSGVFSEIGKSGGASPEAGAWARAEAKAAEVMKSKGVSKAKALDEVFQSDPVLASECEKEE